MSQTFETQFAGRTLTIETGKMALLAGGAVTVRFGDTMVLGTANRSDPRPGLDFFPLTVEFEERMYAAGKIPGGFIKRESRPSEQAILACRLTDRPIRPLFPEGYKDDVQIVITVLSTDQENQTDVLGTFAASCALTISAIPFLGPIGAVRIGRIDGEFVVNPTISDLERSDIDLIVSGTRDAIMMVEAGASIVPEDVMAEAILFGHRALQPLIDIQEQMRAAVGKPKVLGYPRARHRFRPRVRQEGPRARLRVRRRRHRDDRPRSQGRRPDRDRRRSRPRRPDRRSLLHVREPGPRHLRRPDARHHRRRRRRRSGRHGGGREAARVRRRRSGRGPQRRLRPRLPGRGPGRDRASSSQAATSTPSSIAREGYPDLESYKLGDIAQFFGIAVETAHRGLADAETTAAILARFAADLAAPHRQPPGRHRHLDPRQPRGRRGCGRPARRRAPAGSRQQEPLLADAEEDRPQAHPRRGDPHGRPRRRRDPPDHRSRSAFCRAPTAPGLFTRGQTQALTVATLGPISDVQRIDTISPETEKRYLHHYNMPPYSTGENKPMRGPGRREIGHGHLAERALLPVLPSEEEFPYVIRLVSECVTSNGSTSMASTCGSSLALMDAGVPIKAAVGGAAMGLISEPDGRFVVLTDILGKEDAFGDMDFKVTGTREGVTALQMDIKVKGINEAIIRQGLQKAHAARMAILDKMDAVIPTSRTEMSSFAPRIITIKINPEKIRDIIGKGGSVIRKIQEETGTEINVEDDGTVQIAAVSGDSSRKAVQWIESLTREVEVGGLYLGKVTRIMGFGCFVEILPGKEGLIRIGELADYHVPTVEDVVSVGDEVMVVVVEIDRQGRINLSRKAAMQRHLAKTDAE